MLWNISDVEGYVKTPWENFPSRKTAINKDRMNKIEEGIYRNREYIRTYGRRLVIETGLDPVAYYICGTPNTSPLTIEAVVFNSGGIIDGVYSAMGMVVNGVAKLELLSSSIYSSRGSITIAEVSDLGKIILIRNKAGFNIKVWVTGSDYVVVQTTAFG